MLKFFIGSYTKYLSPDFGGTGQGIYTVEMNSETGELKVLHTQKSTNPSYLALSDDNQLLYTSEEVSKQDKPNVKAFKVNKDYSLSFMNEQPIDGAYPCHIETFNNHVFVACYGSGNVPSFPLDENMHIQAANTNYYHSGSSINKERQQEPHCHQVSIHPNKKDVYVCDLGIDTIKAYHFQGSEFVANSSKDIAVSAGGGVRHMVFNHDASLAYALNELTSDVSILKSTGDKFEQISRVSSLPSDYKGQPSASAIRIHPNGKWLYTGNRILEAITAFDIKGEQLSVIEYQYTNGHVLREFNITPDGKWLIACHQDSHDTVVYRIQQDGSLAERYRTKAIESPVCVTFLS